MNVRGSVLIFCISLGLFHSAAPLVRAGDQANLVGKPVTVVTWNAKFQVANRPSEKASFGDTYEVGKVTGAWLWIPARNGYLRRADVLPFGEAVGHFTAAVQKDPSAERYYERGIIWQKRGEIDKALADFSEAIRLKPSTASYYNARGDAWLFEMRSLEKAIADFTRAVRLDPNLVEAFKNRGDAFGFQGEWESSIADYTVVIELDSKHVEAFSMRAAAHAAKGDYDRAIADFNEVLRQRPKDLLALGDRADTLAAKRDYDLALADYDQLLKLHPNDAPLRLRRGGVYQAKGDYAAALRDYNETARLEPRQPHAYERIARLRATCPDARERDGKQAVEFATKALRLEPYKMESIRETLAAAYAEAGDFAQAVKWQKEAIELLPASSPIPYLAKTLPMQRETLLARLKLYEAGRPYREEPGQVVAVGK